MSQSVTIGRVTADLEPQAKNSSAEDYASEAENNSPYVTLQAELIDGDRENLPE